MRVFPTLSTAIREIRRDLHKSPEVLSTRVQNKDGIEVKGREALAYSYTLPYGSVPADLDTLVDIGAEYFPFWKQEREAILRWADEESNARWEGAHGNVIEPKASHGYHPDKLHPRLEQVMEGTGYSYEYRTRLIGMIPAVVSALKNNPDSRRAYWPIFHPLDSLRATMPTRIPCTLGYHFLVRVVPGLGPQLHVTYVQRSADFDSFWLSDVFMATQMQFMVYSQLIGASSDLFPDLSMGNLTHVILSFHTFNTHEEIY